MLDFRRIRKNKDCYKVSEPNILMVGFNRRFAPQVMKIQELIKSTNGPKAMVMIVNAGEISKSLAQDSEIGGGRIKGEVCHFVDLLRFIADCSIMDYQIKYMDNLTKDTVSVQLYFKDGSIGTIHYFANGSSDYPKEKLEIFVEGKILILDNFENLLIWMAKLQKNELWKQDKGQNTCIKAFIKSINEVVPHLYQLKRFLRLAKFL